MTILEASKIVVVDLITRSYIFGVLHLHKHFKWICRVIRMRILSPVLGRSGFIDNLAGDGLHTVSF